jgi:hypothetical protein
MAYLSGWKYRKKLTISNTGSALSDYQLLFTINRSSGSDSGFTVYLDTKCESDYDDIRFTTSDGTTLLDYWIESASSSTAKIWVEIDSIAASGNTAIYIHYGNSSASAVSNGDDTFPFFDDFNNGTTLDTAKWTDTGSGTRTITIANSIATLTGGAGPGYAYPQSNVVFGTNYAVRSRGNIDPTSTDPTHQKGIGMVASPKVIWWMSGFPTASLTKTRCTEADPENYQGGYDSTVTGGYHIYDIIRNGTTSILFNLDNVWKVTETTDVVTGNLKVALVAYNSGVTTLVDWILVRKYTTTEPIVSAWGSEELVPYDNGIIPIWTSLVFTDATIVPDHTTIEASYTYPNDYILIEWS